MGIMTDMTHNNINGWMTHLSDESRFHISVDCAIFGYDEEDLKVLLMECDFPAYKGMWSLVGDLLNQNETINNAAKRILYENTNMQEVYMEQVESFSGIKRHPLGRVITLAYYSLINKQQYEVKHPTKLKLKWVKLKDIKELAFDHKLILDTCHNMLKRQIRLNPIIFDLLPDKFSLKQLQKLFEVVLGVEIDKRNFRRRMNNQGLLIDVDETQCDVSHRPAKLYRFDYQKYKVINDCNKLSFII